jgi:hypothetical protein
MNNTDIINQLIDSEDIDVVELDLILRQIELEKRNIEKKIVPLIVGGSEPTLLTQSNIKLEDVLLLVKQRNYVEALQMVSESDSQLLESSNYEYRKEMEDILWKSLEQSTTENNYQILQLLNYLMNNNTILLLKEYSPLRTKQLNIVLSKISTVKITPDILVELSIVYYHHIQEDCILFTALNIYRNNILHFLQEVYYTPYCNTLKSALYIKNNEKQENTISILFKYFDVAIEFQNITEQLIKSLTHSPTVSGSLQMMSNNNNNNNGNNNPMRHSIAIMRQHGSNTQAHPFRKSNSSNTIHNQIEQYSSETNNNSIYRLISFTIHEQCWLYKESITLVVETIIYSIQLNDNKNNNNIEEGMLLPNTNHTMKQLLDLSYYLSKSEFQELRIPYTSTLISSLYTFLQNLNNRIEQDAIYLCMYC